MAMGTVSAQSVNIDTKIGLKSYTISHDRCPGFDSNTGLHADIPGHVHLNRQLGLQPELVYSMSDISDTCYSESDWSFKSVIKKIENTNSLLQPIKLVKN